MLSRLLSVGIAAVGLFLFLQGRLDGQDKEKPPQEEEMVTRYKVFYWIEGYPIDEENKIGLSEHESQADAGDAATQFKKSNQDNSDSPVKVVKVEVRAIKKKIIRGARGESKRPDPSAARPLSVPQPGIPFQKVKPVDVGAPEKGKKASGLAGRKGQGKIGDSKITMEFQKDGKLVISGDFEAQGKWSESDAGGVLIETKLATYRGNVKGEKVAGLRFFKDNRQPLTEWSIELEKVDGQRKRDGIVGTQWTNDGGGESWDFQEGGILVVHTGKKVFQEAGISKGKWERTEDGIIVTMNGTNRKFKCVIKDDILEYHNILDDGRVPPDPFILKKKK